MTKKRQDGLLLLVLASAIFVASGFIMLRADNSAPDFKGLYYGARCLLQHGDPYSKVQISRVYKAEAWQRPPDPPQKPGELPFASAQIYLPGAILLCVPFAWLSWAQAQILWLVLLVCVFLLSAFLAWDLAADYAPVLSAFLIGYVIINSLIFYTSGNPAGIAVSLCIISVWCFIRNRYVTAGVLCLALSLVLKPHDAGFVWLYFLVVGSAQRKRALQSLTITLAISLAGLLWVSHVAPHWLPEMRANLSESLQHNQIDDPSPNSINAHTASSIINLQSVISFFRDDPHFYDPISYLIVAPLIVVWLIATIKARSYLGALFALAPIVSLTMLPVYHRACDAKLLMLALPACCLLIAERAPFARSIFLMNAIAIVLTGDITLAVLLTLSDHVHASGLTGALLKLALLRPATFALLAMTIVNLALYVRRACVPPASQLPYLSELA